MRLIVYTKTKTQGWSSRWMPRLAQSSKAKRWALILSVTAQVKNHPPIKRCDFRYLEPQSSQDGTGSLQGKARFFPDPLLGSITARWGQVDTFEVSGWALILCSDPGEVYLLSILICLLLASGPRSWGEVLPAGILPTVFLSLFSLLSIPR